MYFRNSRQTKPKLRTEHPRFFTLEKLEYRQLLAIWYGPFIDSQGYLNVLLDDENDVVSLQFLDTQTARLTVNGVDFEFARTSFDDVRVSAGGGNDQVTLAPEVNLFSSISAGKGNDVIVGGSGTDQITGGEGNDTLIGGAGNDVIYSADASGCFVGPDDSEICGPVDTSASADSVVGGDGDDRIWAEPGSDTIDGGAGNNEINWIGVAPDCIWVSTADDPTQPPESGPDNILLDFVNATTARLTVNGSSFDFPRSEVACLEVETGAGDDRVELAASVDVPATVRGGDGNDTLIGSSGDDSLDGGLGDDWIFGNDGNDTLDGGDGNDSLDGGNGNDSILGGLGDDTLADGMGDDTLDGGGGNDVYVQSPGSDDVLRDSGGIDTVSFSRAARAIRFDLGRNTGQRQAVDANRNTVALNGLFENLMGSRYADDLTGDGRGNRIDGGGGDDSLDGGGGDRVPHGGSADGTDRRAGTGCDGDTLIGGDGHDWLDGGRGSDMLEGGRGNDVLVGDPARDQLIGGGGSNRISRVTKSSNSCDGSIRSAVAASGISFDPATGTLVVIGDEAGSQDDQISLATTSQGFVTVTINGAVHSSDPDSADFNSNLDSATVTSVLLIQIQGLDGNDILAVGDGFTAADGQIELLGGSGNDRLQGSAEAELLVGGSGDDTLIGGGGNDTLAGNAGNDSLDGGAGRDTVDFSGSARGVRVNLLDGTTRGQGDDVLAAIECVIGSGMADLLIGDDLANLLAGGDGHDTIRGGNGDDTLLGEAGNDRLSGDAGTDSLDGGTGSNKLRTGLGQAPVLANVRRSRSEVNELTDSLADDLEDWRPTTRGRRRG